MFKVIFQVIGIVGAWGLTAWLSLILLPVFGVEVESSNETGILAFGLVAFATSLGMEVYDWCRFNRLVVEKKG